MARPKGHEVVQAEGRSLRSGIIFDDSFTPGGYRVEEVERPVELVTYTGRPPRWVDIGMRFALASAGERLEGRCVSTPPSPAGEGPARPRA